MNRSIVAVVAMFGFALAGGPTAPGVARAQTVKMGTMAPEGSTWHKALKQIADRWSQETGGKVKLRIFAGGVQGDEGDCIRKMRINQLQACAITGVSLKDITPEPMAISVPLMITGYPELDHVMAKEGSSLEKAVEDKGFIILTWTDAGVLYFFSKKPAPTPTEAFPQKIFAVSGDPGAEEAWRVAGFTPVVLSSVNMIPSLQTGMIDAFTSTPLVALSLGWYSAAGNMTMAPLGMLIGALVVSKGAWEKIPADQRAKLLAIAREEGNAIRPEARRQEVESIKVMEEKGLKVVRPTPAQLAEWEKLSDRIFPAAKGKVVPVATFDAIKKTRDEFRAQQPRK